MVRCKAKRPFFVQGGAADSIFYIHSGRAKLTVVSKTGKEATVMMLAAGDFVGEESLASVGQHRKATACAITACKVLKIDRDEMLRALHEEHSLSNLFLQFMLNRAMRAQADLVDQLSNSSERRLARLLLLMAEYGSPRERVTLLPKVSQEILAEMIGTTRARVSFFMSRFRKLGYIDYGYLGYKSRIRVDKSLLNIVLKDHVPAEYPSGQTLLDPPPSPAKDAKRAKVA